MSVDALPPTSALAPLSREQRAWQWRILISTYFAYAGFYLTRKVFSVCKKDIAHDFGVDLSMVAHIWTAFLVAYMIGQFVSSFVGRAWGPRVLLLGGLGVSMAINVAFGFTNSYWTFLAFMVFNGLVQAAGWPGCVGGVSEWLRKNERGTIMGIWSTNYLVGNLVVKSLGGYLLGAYGWRYSFLGCTAVAFVIWWLVFLWQRNRPEDVGLSPIVPPADTEVRVVDASTQQHVSTREYLQLALSPIILIMGLSYFCVKFLRYALDSWLPTFLQLQGVAKDQAAYYSSIFDIAGIAGALLAGYLLDRWFRGRWPLLCAMLGVGMALGYLAVSRFGGSAFGLALWYGVVGVMLYGPDTLLGGAVAVQVAGERNGVAVAGLVNGIGSIGPVIQEEVIGFLTRDADKHPQVGVHNTNLLTLAMSTAFVLLMLVTMAYIRRSHARPVSPV